MEEEWKDIPGYVGLYKVSNRGRVKSLRSDHILKPADNYSGYKFVGLYKNGESRSMYVHRLVLICFVGEKIGMECNHKDGDKSNNHLKNLEWVTRSENGKHAYRNGLNRVSEYQKKCTSEANRGSGHGNSVLHEKDIPVIREMRSSGATHEEIANKYGVHRETIGNIIRGNTWTHV